MALPQLEPTRRRVLAEGLVIPAHPLALTEQRRLDERHQRGLSRYYLAAGAGGLAVAVHTTQFAIREPRIGLLQPVLELATEVAHEGRVGSPVMIAGVCGGTEEALEEARLAADLGYDLALIQLGSLANAPEERLLEHCRLIAEVLPLFGFYLQPAVGGRRLEYSFWRRFAEIDNVTAVKIAPFNRYQTLDVVRGVADSGRAEQIALYTGNDDHIVLDLLAAYRLAGTAGPLTLRMVGGLLGHWAVWTRCAADLVNEVHSIVCAGQAVPTDLLVRANEITDTNAALFDPVHACAGSIAGIHEILRRQGLLLGRWCLDPNEDLSPGQLSEIERVCASYPHLQDDAFVAEHLDEWLS